MDSVMDDWEKNVSLFEDDKKGVCVISNVKFHKNELIGYFEGYAVEDPTVHSVTFRESIIEGTGALKNLAHSCDPNAEFLSKERWLYSIKEIEEGEEVTIDYSVTEPIISAPFICECGAAGCRGYIETVK